MPSPQNASTEQSKGGPKGEPSSTPGGSPPSSAESSPPIPVSPRGQILLGTYLLFFVLFLVYLLMTLWPQELSLKALTNSSPNPWHAVEIFPLIGTVSVAPEVRLLALIIVAGALGSMIHAVRSFTVFAGNRQLYRSWVGWYLLRPVSGTLLALVFYALVRGGLMSANVSNSTLTVASLTGIAALVGMFSEDANKKLKELFRTLFAPSTEEETSEPLTVASAPIPKPEIGWLNPEGVKVGTTNRTVTITGNNFIGESMVRVDGENRKPTVTSAKELTFELTDEDVAVTGEKKVSVVNPPPSGGESEGLTLKIT